MPHSHSRRAPQKPLVAAIVAGLLAANPVAATTRMVTVCADTGTGGLRQAIAASASGDTVDMTALTCSKLTLTAGELPVTVGSLTIRGPGAGQLTIDAGSQSRVMRHAGTGILGLSGLTLAHGFFTAIGNQDGGCLFSNGSVSATDTVLSNCMASYNFSSGISDARGGAIFAYANVALVRSRVTASQAHANYGVAKGGGVYAAGKVNIKYSTIDANFAAAENPPPFNTQKKAFGGGLFVEGGGVVRGSTISGNSAIVGGGAVFINADGPTDIVNSTVSGNVASENVGGLWLYSATLNNSTVAFNREGSKYAGGVLVGDGGDIDMQSSIIAMNTTIGNSTGIDFRSGSPATVTGSHNLIHNTTSTLPADTLRVDPLLGALADNGGATRTHALQAASPAIDAGNNTVPLTYDQRGSGFRRVAHGVADIGAYEFDDTIFVDGFD